jgi:hypothetical protein
VSAKQRLARAVAPENGLVDGDDDRAIWGCRVMRVFSGV